MQLTNKLLALATLALVCLLMTNCDLAAQSTTYKTSGYSILVGSYKTPVPTSTFAQKGLSGVSSQSGEVFSGTKYYYGHFGDESAASAALGDVVSKGFENARIINWADVNAKCPKTCGEDPFKIRHIFFDFDESFLRAESRAELDKLHKLLAENPDYVVELHAHTDAKGSNAYNEALAQRRKNAAKNYLISQGIASSRIGEFTYGENMPIAKNDIAGQDLPEGRQFNRRVELRVKDSGLLIDVVEDIMIPESLKN